MTDHESEERESAESAQPPVGSLAEEAARLIGSLADVVAGQARDWAGAAESEATGAERHGRRIDTGAPECAYCPICRSVHVLREAGPEVAMHVAAAAASLAQAAGAVLDAAGSRSKGGEDHPGVEKIDLDDGGAGPAGQDPAEHEHVGDNDNEWEN